MTLLAVTIPGGPEWIIIGLIFVLLFGAKKLPELGGAIGKSIRSFKDGVDEGKEGEEGEPTDARAEGAESADPTTPIAPDGK
jgi:sec-independent protein translocase protein TatA